MKNIVGIKGEPPVTFVAIGVSMLLASILKNLKRQAKLRTLGWALMSLATPASPSALAAEDAKSASGDKSDLAVVCPSPLPQIPTISVKDVYKEMPFKAGEQATYLVTWGGAKVGYGTMEVRKPIRHQGTWQRVFHVEANTGDWFSKIFVAKEQINAISRPFDFAISSFYMDQNEGKLFSSTFVQKKWLEFDHDHCKVTEKVEQPEKKDQTDTFELAYGANDSLGAVYNLRAKTFKLGQKERILVYTSQKNWWLEAEPVAFESVTVEAGTFDTVKLKLQTFIGKDLQQKGDVFAWYAVKTPQKQLVQIQGDIKLGSVWIKLDHFEAGKD